MFKKNISNTGRLMRGITGLIFLIGATFAYLYLQSIALTVVFAVIGMFTLFEALRGWCALRACGVKTKY